MTDDVLDTMREYAEYAELKSEKLAFEKVIEEVTRLRAALEAEKERGDKQNEYMIDMTADRNRLSDAVVFLRSALEAEKAKVEKMREALLFAELMASEMGVDPREKCQRIYDELHPIREGERDDG